jgi:hypothetical protein
MLSKEQGTKKVVFAFSVHEKIDYLGASECLFFKLPSFDEWEVRRLVEIGTSRGLEIEIDHLELHKETFGIPSVLRDFIALGGSRESLEMSWGHFFENIKNEPLIKFNFLIRGIWCRHSSSLKKYLLDKSGCGFSTTIIDLIGLKLKEVHPRLFVLAPQNTEREVVPEKVALTSVVSRLEAFAIGYQVDIKMSDWELALEYLFLEKAYQEVIEYSSFLARKSWTPKIIFWVYQSSLLTANLELCAETVGLTNHLPYDPLCFLVNFQEIRDKINRVSPQIYKQILLEFQKKHEGNDLAHLIVETEIARVENLLSRDKVNSILQKIEQHPRVQAIHPTNRSQMEKILLVRIKFVKGVYAHTNQDFEASHRWIKSCSDELKIHEDSETFLNVQLITSVVLFILGRLSELEDFYMQMEELFLRVKKDNFLKGLALNRVNLMFMHGDYLKLRQLESDFFEGWWKIPLENIAFYDVELFEAICFVKLYCNQTPEVVRFVERALDENRLDQFPQHKAWAIAFLGTVDEIYPHLLGRSLLVRRTRLVRSQFERDEFQWFRNYYDELLSQSYSISDEVDRSERFKPLDFDDSTYRVGLIYLDYFLGVKELLKGRVSESKKFLERTAVRCADGIHPLMGTRAGIFLALVDLSEGRFDSVIARVGELQVTLKSDLPTKVEFSLVPVIGAVAWLKMGNEVEFNKMLLEVDPGSPVGYLVDLILAEKGTGKFSSPTAKSFLSPSAKGYYEKIFKLIYPEKLKAIEVRSAQGTKTYHSYNLPQFDSREFLLFFDERMKRLKVSNKIIDFGTKPLIYSLFVFFLENQGTELSKHDLAVRVWKETYNPPVHDPRIYIALRRMKKILGKAISLESKRFGYVFKVEGPWIWIRGGGQEAIQNERQNWILSYLENNQTISRYEVQKSLQISPTLAKKELSVLLKKGFISRMGQARATEYIKVRTL